MEKSFERCASPDSKGNVEEGSGTLTSESGVLREKQYSFRTRFYDGIGTSPEGDAKQFHRSGRGRKTNCPIAGLLNTTISMTAGLEK